MQWFYDAAYDYGGGLPEAPREIHGFVLRKPSEIYAHLAKAHAVSANDFHRPARLTNDDLLRVHDPALIRRLNEPDAVAAAIELSEAAWMPTELVRQAIVDPQLRAAGGTVAAFRAAADGHWAINLSGGFHHARRNLSHGFCLINDVAIAVARLRHEGIRRKVLIIDLDLHQGDGNAMIFGGDSDVYTVSIHEEGVFPIPKANSRLDIGLGSRTADAEYLTAVESALRHAQRHFEPEILVYLAGSDPYVADPLGSLRLTRNGLRERDQRVARFACELGCPMVVLPAGGYSDESPSITAAGFAAIAEIAP